MTEGERAEGQVRDRSQPRKGMPGTSAARHATDGELCFFLRLPAHPLSVSVARHAVRGLNAWLSDDRRDRLELITSEAVTNALLHGTPAADDVIEYEVRASPESITVRVGDHGPQFSPPGTLPTSPQVGGYGLLIISQLAASWEVNRTADGNELLFTV